MVSESTDSGSGGLSIVRALLTGGTVATRLVVAGSLLVIGLPLLTILVYIWGYPSTPAPLPLVVLADALQVLIVLNAVVVVAQLVTRTGVRRTSLSNTPGHKAEARETPWPLPQYGPMGLRELSLSLAEMIWGLERNGRAVLGQAVLDYIRDAVMTEVEFRRRRQALERRWAELQVSLSRRSDAEPSATNGPESAKPVPLHGSRLAGGRGGLGKDVI